METYGVPEHLLRHRRVPQDYVQQYRQEVVRLREVEMLTFLEIGKIFGRSDHASVMIAYKKAKGNEYDKKQRDHINIMVAKKHARPSNVKLIEQTLTAPKPVRKNYDHLLDFHIAQKNYDDYIAKSDPLTQKLARLTNGERELHNISHIGRPPYRRKEQPPKRLQGVHCWTVEKIVADISYQSTSCRCMRSSASRQALSSS
jgi:hypothetical protein